MYDYDAEVMKQVEEISWGEFEDNGDAEGTER
jgi:hypothetical protein